MREQDHRLADAIEQRDARRDSELRLVADKLHLAFDEVVEDRIALRALLRRIAGPLCVLFHAREIAARKYRSGPDLGQLGRRAHAELTINTGYIRRASARGVIHHVDDVALINQVIRPAWTAVGCL